MSDTRQSIIVNGQDQWIGARVVKWYEADGAFNGYDTSKVQYIESNRKTGREKVRTIRGRRYKKRLGGLKKIRQVVLHHTGGYRPETTFNTLHNQRGLSVQFILSDSGVIYQTLDAVEVAWHAGKANKTSVGVECCLYPQAWKRPNAYSERMCDKFSLQPHSIAVQNIHGRKAKVFMMPPKQIDSLARLIAGMWVARSKIGDIGGPPRFMEDNNDRIIGGYCKDWPYHIGMLTHANINRDKWDPAGINFGNLEIAVERYFDEFLSDA